MERSLADRLNQIRDWRAGYEGNARRRSHTATNVAMVVIDRPAAAMVRCMVGHDYVAASHRVIQVHPAARTVAAPLRHCAIAAHTSLRCARVHSSARGVGPDMGDGWARAGPAMASAAKAIRQVIFIASLLKRFSKLLIGLGHAATLINGRYIRSFVAVCDDAILRRVGMRARVRMLFGYRIERFRIVSHMASYCFGV